MKTLKLLNRHLMAGMVALTLAGTALPAVASASNGNASWHPKVSERLVKLPAKMVKRVVQQDYSGSGLAMAVSDVKSQISLKQQTMTDLKSAIAQSQGEVQFELRHQFLAEKREYINLMSRHLELRENRLKTQKRFYERYLEHLNKVKQQEDEEVVELRTKQEELRKRFERSINKVDMKLFGTPSGVKRSKYSQKYDKNLELMKTLAKALEKHPMANRTSQDPQGANKRDYIRTLISESDSEASLIQQEKMLVGYMAKLAALDALSLSEEVLDPEMVDSDVTEDTPVANAVDFFITQ